MKALYVKNPGAIDKDTSLSALPVETASLILNVRIHLYNMKESGRSNSMDEVIERISTLEGRVSEHDRIFDMIREEIRGLREYIDGRIDDTNARIDDLRLDMNGRIDDTNKKIDDLKSDMNGRIDDTNKKIDDLKSDMNGRIDDTNTRIDDLRLDMNGRIDGINKRIDETNRRIDETNKRIDDTNRKIEEMDIRLNRRIDSNFKWMLGIQIAMWITIISAILLH